MIWPRIKTHRYCTRCGRYVPWHHTRPGYGCLKCREQDNRK